MKAGSLCTGILGLDMAAAAVYGCELAWWSEYEDAPASIVTQHTDAPNLGDLTVIDWAEVEPVDVLTAGYPCQPFSHAGKRKGSNDVRHLWLYVAEAVRVLRPRRVVLENVAGHLSLGFGDVLRDLAEAGFDAEWCVLRASDVGAPHQRARVFIVASDADQLATGWDCGTAPRPEEPDAGRGAANVDHRSSDADRARPGSAPDPADIRHERGGPARRRGHGPADSGHAAANADGGGLEVGGEPHRGPLEPRVEAPRRGDPHGLGAISWGDYRPAIERWERVLGRCAPAPTDDAGRLGPTFVEWMMGYPEGWTAALGRTQALKALGNAVCPQQGEAAIRLLEAA